MKPSLGRIVHYVSRSGKHLPAIIIEVSEAGLSLEIFGDFHYKFVELVQLDPSAAGVCTWHWPEREE